MIPLGRPEPQIEGMKEVKVIFMFIIDHPMIDDEYFKARKFITVVCTWVCYSFLFSQPLVH